MFYDFVESLSKNKPLYKTQFTLLFRINVFLLQYEGQTSRLLLEDGLLRFRPNDSRKSGNIFSENENAKPRDQVAGESSKDRSQGLRRQRQVFKVKLTLRLG
jgi:hypothetical protein